MDLLEAAKRLQARGFFEKSGCADAATNLDMRLMREAIAAEDARRQSEADRRAFDSLPDDYETG